MEEHSSRRWLTLEEAANHVGVHTMTVRRWGAEGRLRLYRIGPRALRVDVLELDAMLHPIPTGGDAA